MEGRPGRYDAAARSLARDPLEVNHIILVTGSTGTTGNEVLKRLRAIGRKARALIRSPHKAEAVKGQGVEVALGDYERPESYREALIGVEKVFLVMPMSPRMAETEVEFIGAAKAAGVRHVVLISTIGSQFQPGITLGQLHLEGERALQSSGMAWTILRPNGFMTNFLGFAGSVKSEGKIYGCAADAKFAPVDPRDVAEVAVRALTEPGHEGKAYYLTGQDSMSHDTIAEKLGAAIGRAVQYVDVPGQALKGAMVQMGLSDWLSGALVEFYEPGAREHAGALSNHVHQVLGRPPRSFDQWARELSAVFR